MVWGSGSVMRAIEISAEGASLSTDGAPAYVAPGITAMRLAQERTVGCHMPARAMSATISTISAPTAETARAGPFDFAMAIEIVRWNGGSTILLAWIRSSATSLQTACSGSTV